MKGEIKDMKKTTPADMLIAYRAHSPMFVTEQVNEFVKMPVEKQNELLFYMLIHSNEAIRQINNVVDPHGLRIGLENMEEHGGEKGN